MARFYAVNSGRVPGVYRTWAEASAQTNGFPGSVHCSFRNLSDAVEFSGIPLQQQPGWVRTALGVPEPAVAQPSSAAGPPPSQTPTPASALPPSGRQASIVTSSPVRDPTASLVDALHRVSIHSPAAPAPVIGPRAVSPSSITFSRRSGVLENTSNRLPGNQQAPALTSFFARAAAGVSITSGPREPHHSTPISSPNPSTIHSPYHSAHPIGAQRNVDSRSSQNHSGWIEDSILSGVFHSPTPNANTSSEDTANNTAPVTGQRGVLSSPLTLSRRLIEDSMLFGVFHSPAPNPNTSSEDTTKDTSSNGSTSSDDDWLDPMEPMAGGLYGMQDSHPNHYQITLRTASPHATHYAPILTSLLGQHAVNYLFLHYYSAGSTVVIANAYAEHRSSARRFVEHLVREGMPPRQAAYLWTIISPETIDHPQSRFSYFRWAAVMRALGRGGASTPHGERVAGPDSDSVSSENEHVTPNDTEQGLAEAGVTSGVNARTDIYEAGGGDTDNGSSGSVQGGGPDYMEIDDDEIEYVDSPEENANEET